MRRTMMLLSSLLLASKWAVAAPNVLVVIADDMGWGDLGIHGNGNVLTPALDGLAKQGVRFSNFYVDPVCAPTRAALLTGRWARRSGVVGVSTGGERMNLAEVTLADVLKTQGYATACFGKWHNGSAYPYHPMGRGFDEFMGFCCGHWGDYIDPTLERNGEPVKTKGFIADVFTDAAIAFVEEPRSEPFFCWLSFCTPHSPFEMPDSEWERVEHRPLSHQNRDSSKENPNTTRAALALVENLDRNVGRLLDALERRGLRENTIVVFLSDNGPNSWRWNAGLRGKKGSVDEGGVKVPFMVSWLGRIPRGVVVGQPAGHVDLLPSLCSLTGAAPPDGVALDGVDLSALITGGVGPLSDRYIFASWRKQASVRKGKWRATTKALYDIEKDPMQRQNLADDQELIHRGLVMELEKHLKEISAAAVPGPNPLGHSDFPVSVLPVQDGILQGEGLRFSSRHPNASWVTGWTDVGMAVCWDVDVVEAGLYEVELLVTASERAVGNEVVVSARGGELRASLDQAFDPEDKPNKDRVPRSESAHKEFRSWKLGKLQLEPGRQKLVVKIEKMPNGVGMDLRSIRLRK